MLGRPVARRLVAEGNPVRALVRDPDRARAVLPRECDLVRGDVTDDASLARAMDGVGAVYINLAAPRSARRPDIERSGTPAIVDAARRAGVGRILKISFMGVPEGSWWQLRHKAESEQAVRESGIAWTIFQPTWFMESLPLFRMGGRLVAPRVEDAPVYWISGDDYARQVAAALNNGRTANRTYIIQGPQPLSFRCAGERFARAWQPHPLKYTEIPLWALRPLCPVVADVRYLLDLLRVTFETNTTFEANDAWNDLGRPAMTVEDYAGYMRRTGDIPRK